MLSNKITHYVSHPLLRILQFCGCNLRLSICAQIAANGVLIRLPSGVVDAAHDESLEKCRLPDAGLMTGEMPEGRTCMNGGGEINA